MMSSGTEEVGRRRARREAAKLAQRENGGEKA